MYRNRKLPYLFMLPAILTILFVSLAPFLYSVAISLTDWDGISPSMSFVGLNNYKTMLTDSTLRDVLSNNVVYFIWLVGAQNVFALIIAMVLNGKFRGRNFFRATIFFPTLVSSVAVGFIWSLMYNPMAGVLTTISKILDLPTKSLIWLGDPIFAKYSIIATSIWQWAGWNVIIYFAGLQSIPDEMYEAAAIDGAGVLKRTFFIVLPLLAPAITINIVMSSIGALKLFDLPYIMTGGGPGHTSSTIAIAIYHNSFLMNKMGYGTAISLVLFVLVLIVSAVQTILLRRQEERVS